MSKHSFRPTVLCIFGLLLLATSSVSAVETFKTSNIAGGHQIWFEVEDFDERDPADDSSFALVDEAGAYGKAISSISGSDGQSFIRYTFDISKAGGSGGTWYFWGRVINPSNQSDFMVVAGHPGDVDPVVLPVSGLVNGQRVFEQNVGPPWEWTNPNHEEGHTKTLRDGENTMHILARQSGALWDVFMWTDDPGYVPTDADYENAEVPSAGVAGGPSPGNDVLDLPWYINELSWSAGDFAKTHNVYFGANFADVNDRAASALLAEGLTDTSQAMQTELETTYYWAVDEVNGAPDFAVHAGDVWNFTVEAFANVVTGVTATADSQFNADTGPEKVVNGSGLTDGLHGTTAEDMWQSAALPTTIEFVFDNVYVLHEMKVWNQNQLIEGLLGFGAKDVVLEVSANGSDFVVMEGVGPFNRAPGAAGYAADTTVAFNGTRAKAVRLTITSNYGPLPNTGLSEVQFTAIPVFPREFDPADGAETEDLDVTLSWRAGRFTVEHQVLLSQDRAAVADGSAVIATTADKRYALSGLQYGSTYFTQIIDVAADGTTYAGPINLFITPGSQAIDDMESYRDEEFLEIWATWIDGFGDEANNGALVGANPSGGNFSPESAVVHGGKQSLPIHFDNTAAPLSEAMRTFATPLAWSQQGVKGLVIYFHGSSTNTGGQLYVRINNTKVAYDGDAADLMRGGWNKWYIPLADVAGDLSRVTSLTLGIDGGGQGVVYIDDITVTSEARETITPVTPSSEGLLVHWAFDEAAGGTVGDSSGNNHVGTINGATWTAGGFDGSGHSLAFGGDGDFVVNSDTVVSQVNGLSAVTVAVWVNSNVTDTDHGFINFIDPDGGDDGGMRYDAAGASFSGTNVMKMSVHTTGGNLQLESSSGVQTTEWQHVAMSWQSGESLKLYINGMLDTPTGATAPAVGTVDTVTQLLVGKGGKDELISDSWEGLIDDVRIYNRALSDAEMAGLAGRTLPFDI